MNTKRFNPDDAMKEYGFIDVGYVAYLWLKTCRSICSLFRRAT